MKWIRTFKKGDGFISQEWSADEMFTFDMLKYLVLGVFISILSALASGLCLLVRLYDYEEGELAPNMVGIGVGLYFVIDYCLKWPVTFILRLFEDDPTMKFMAACNLSILITHVLLVLFGDSIYFGEADESIRKPKLIIITAITLGVSYFLSRQIF
jgi:hypothetical protein